MNLASLFGTNPNIAAVVRYVNGLHRKANSAKQLAISTIVKIASFPESNGRRSRYDGFAKDSVRVENVVGLYLKTAIKQRFTIRG